MDGRIIKAIDFQNTARKKLRIMGDTKEFSDVTLTSADNMQFHAHKVILAAISPFFRDYFNMNVGSHSVIGVNSKFLSSMLDIVYCGETKIEAENSTRFIGFLQDCRVLEPEMTKK